MANYLTKFMWAPRGLSRNFLRGRGFKIFFWMEEKFFDGGGDFSQKTLGNWSKYFNLKIVLNVFRTFFLNFVLNIIQSPNYYWMSRIANYMINQIRSLLALVYEIHLNIPIINSIFVCNIFWVYTFIHNMIKSTEKKK